jgi:antibiotic biosynthesis monooxygenase (ABM) superfamily enzyme
MIRVIEGLKVKDSLAMQPILLKLRANAMQYPGYVGSEFLIEVSDDSIIVVISTWVTRESWKLWEQSKVRENLYLQAGANMVEKPKISVYRIVPTQMSV